ncbi:MAG: WhiB family transcriptional regulator [Acidimicrobiia bacterium]|nr:WhiB family transcriptional regulator [Acidimicrobiia bacterium]
MPAEVLEEDLPELALLGWRPRWQVQAACRGRDRRLWFPDRGDSGSEAKQVCRTCPVRLECLRYAMTFPPQTLDGIWGGAGGGTRRRAGRLRLTAEQVIAEDEARHHDASSAR